MLNDTCRQALIELANRARAKKFLVIKINYWWIAGAGSTYNNCVGHTCMICNKEITCSCEPHPGKYHKLIDLVDEHGLMHLKEYGLLVFL